MPARPSQQNASRRCPRGSRDESAAGKVQLRLARHPQPKCSRSCGSPSSPRARQSDGEFGELADAALDLNGAAVLLRHDVVADRQSQAGSFASRLSREERLEQLVPDHGRNADAVITCSDFDGTAEFTCGHPQNRLEFGVTGFSLTLGSSVKAVAKYIQANPRNVLRHEFDRSDHLVEVAFQRDVKALILR